MNTIMWSVHLVLLLGFLNTIKCKTECNNFETCGECIGYAGTERCVWCEQEKVDDFRCQPESILQRKSNSWCGKEYIQNPQSALRRDVDKKFGVAENKSNEIIQLKPQLITIEARPGEEIKFEMSYKPAEHFPLDVYYLMDNSVTMKDHKEALVAQAYDIYNELTNMTNNVRLGIGTFVEKPAYPYYDKNFQTEAHAFENILSLTKDIKQFSEKIDKMKFGSNFDDMEAGMDALMQVMTCEKEIGWRSGSRRIIVLCTDSPYHSAGDGKMLGIIKPNDMKCHLENNINKSELDQDYPSVSQINKVATRGKFSIIFAAISAVRDVYTSTANQIIGTKYAELKQKSNTVDIIKKAYIESVYTIKFNYVTPSFVQLTLDQDCEAKPKRNCESTHLEPIVNIGATLKVLQCPSTNETQEISISPVTLSDTLKIKLNIICKCECEKESELSPKCNNGGYVQCGVCKCTETRYGDACQCNSISSASTQKTVDYFKCLKHKNESEPCSKKGACLCGICKCDQDYSGKYCEYYDKSCYKSNEKLCAGNGKCTLGSCRCDKDWTGIDCSCSTKTDECKAPYSDEVCSGNGKCVCGSCKCNEVEGKNETYTGVFCDSCVDCQAKYCKVLEDYVKCIFVKGTEECKTSFNGTENTDVHVVNKEEISSSKWHDAAWCSTVLDDESLIIFRYYHDPATRRLHIIIQREAEAPPIANKWIALFIAIGVVVLIGLLTLILWKILVDLHDRREYAKFEEESRAQGFDLCWNDTYVEPTANYNNPTFDNKI